MRYFFIGFLLAIFLPSYATTKNLSFSKGYVENEEFEYTKTVNEGDSYVDVTYTFEGVNVAKIEKSSREFDWIFLRGVANYEIKGNPRVPLLSDILTLNSETAKLSILKADYVEYDGFSIIPSEGDIVQSDDSYHELTFSSVYTTNSYYPKTAAAVEDVQKYRGVPFAIVNVFPVQYNPVTKRVRCYKSITFRVSSKEVSNLRKAAPQSLNSLRSVSSNPDKVNDYESNAVLRAGSPKTKTEAEYIIVSTSKYASAVNKLKKWKTMQGFKCKVLSRSSWQDSSVVKKAIEDVYKSQTVKPEYLLIVGDYADVPGERYVHTYDNRRYTYSTDLPYVCMDGASDYTPDMAKGRISVSTLSEANVVVDKIINYERNPIANSKFYNTSTHCAYFQDNKKVNNTVVHDGYEDRRFVLTSEEVRDYLMGWGKTVNRVYFAYNYSTSPQRYNNDSYSNGALLPADLRGYSDVWRGTTSDIVNEINDGRFYVLHRDHGSVDGWGDPSFHTSDIKTLSNGKKLPVVFSMNCLTGSYLDDCCFSEAFLRKSNGGAVGVIGASCISYSGKNDALILGMFNTIYPSPGIQGTFGSNGHNITTSGNKPVYEMGKVLNEGLLKMTQMGYNHQHTYKIFHYFGDPSMRMYTEVPACFNPEIIQNGTSVTVRAGVSGCCIALCSILDYGETYVQTSKNCSVATFSNIDFPYCVVITKQNYKPYVGAGINYIQNKTITNDCEIISDQIYAGNNVTSTVATGNVAITSGNVTMKASRNIVFRKGFKVSGAKFRAYVENPSCNFSYTQPQSSYVAVNGTSKGRNGSGVANNNNLDIDGNYVGDGTTELDDQTNTSCVVYVDGNQLVVKSIEPLNVEVVDMLGRPFYNGTNVQDDRIELKRGVYLIKYGDKVRKILIP